MYIHNIRILKINEVERELILNNLVGESSFIEITAYQDDIESCFELKTLDKFIGAVDTKHLSKIISSYVWDSIERFVPIIFESNNQEFSFSNKEDMLNQDQ